MNLIEVKILNYQILLPYKPHSDTIENISQAALQEYYKLNLKKPPQQKVLYTCDTNGRILSGGLTLPLPFNNNNSKENSGSSSSDIIEVKIEEYSSKDLIPVNQLIDLYRNWQYYLCKQIKEYFEFLSYRENPLSPDSSVLDLLKELSKVLPATSSSSSFSSDLSTTASSSSSVASSSSLSLALHVISCYKILLTKFPQSDLIHYAVKQLCRMFLSTNHYEIGIEILKIFHSLSPLQMKLFNSLKYMKLMIDVENHLLRFLPVSILRGKRESRLENSSSSAAGEEEKDNERDEREKEKILKKQQSEMFTLFDSILSMLKNEELNSLFSQTKEQYELIAYNQNQNENHEALIKAILKEENDENEFDEEIAIYQQKYRIKLPETVRKSLTADQEGEGGGGAVVEEGGPLIKKWNLSRLQTLILSEDKKIRSFSLENLKKLLTATHEAAKASSSGSVSAATTVTTIIPQAVSEDRSELLLPSKNQEKEELLDLPPSSTSSPSLFLSRSASKEKGLSARKSSGTATILPSKPMLPPAVSASSSSSSSSSSNAKILCFSDENQYCSLIKTLIQSLQKSIKGRNQGTNGEPTTENRQQRTATTKQEHLSLLSTAGRLSYHALKATETDLISIKLIFDCLSLLFYFPLSYCSFLTSPSASQLSGSSSSSSSSSSNSNDGSLFLSYYSSSLWNPLINNYLNIVQFYFISNMKEFYRLLFTLSHCYEFYSLSSASSQGIRDGGGGNQYHMFSSNYDLFYEISEKSSFYLSLILFYSSSLTQIGIKEGKIQGNPSLFQDFFQSHHPSGSILPPPIPFNNGWNYCQLPLERITIKTLLLIENSPNYGVFLALSYVLYLVKRHLSSEKEEEAAASTSEGRERREEETRRVGQQGKEGKEKEERKKRISNNTDLHGIDFLNEFFNYDSFTFLSSLWKWIIGRKSNLFIRRLALTILSKIITMNDVSYFIWKLDPIPK
jgi:hypothetical protein